MERVNQPAGINIALNNVRTGMIVGEEMGGWNVSFPKASFSLLPPPSHTYRGRIQDFEREGANCVYCV